MIVLTIDTLIFKHSLITVRQGESFACAEPIAVRSATMSKPSRKITRKMPTLGEDLLITAAAESDSDALPLSETRMDAVLKGYVRTQFSGDAQGVYRQHPEGGGEQHGLWKSNRPIALIRVCLLRKTVSVTSRSSPQSLRHHFRGFLSTSTLSLHHCHTELRDLPDQPDDRFSRPLQSPQQACPGYRRFARPWC